LDFELLHHNEDPIHQHDKSFDVDPASRNPIITGGGEAKAEKAEDCHQSQTSADVQRKTVTQDEEGHADAHLAD
jgi:hypothetical protein